MNRREALRNVCLGPLALFVPLGNNKVNAIPINEIRHHRANRQASLSDLMIRNILLTQLKKDFGNIYNPSLQHVDGLTQYANSVDMKHKYIEDERWDVIGRSIELLYLSMKKRIECTDSNIHQVVFLRVVSGTDEEVYNKFYKDRERPLLTELENTASRKGLLIPFDKDRLCIAFTMKVTKNEA